jgi:hypothetical protein
MLSLPLEGKIFITIALQKNLKPLIPNRPKPLRAASPKASSLKEEAIPMPPMAISQSPALSLPTVLPQENKFCKYP